MSAEDVAIFWDYENCHAAAQYTGYEIVKKIRSVAHSFGSIKLFKAYLELSDPVIFSKSLALRSELQASGVSLTDCPHNGRKDVADKMMLVDMLAYAIDNSPPSTIILISGDRDFAYAVSTLRLRQYRVVIISLAGVHASLKYQASVFLDWNNDVLGAEIADDDWSPQGGPLPTSEGSRFPSHFQREQVRSSTRKFPSFLRRGGSLNSEDFNNVDIMDHIHYKGNDTHARKAGHVDLRVGSKRSNEAVIEIPPSPHPAPPPSSHEPVESLSPTARSPSRTESAPAALFANDLPSNPTLVSEPWRMTDGRTLASKSHEGSHNHINREANGSVGFSFVPAPPAPSNQGATIAQNDQSIAAVTPISNIGLTPSPSPSSADPPNIQLHPLNPTSFPSGGSVTSASLAAPFVQENAPKVVTPIFSLLVKRLEFHRSKGFFRPLRSGIALELATTDNLLYRRAGTERFGQYVALAEKAGIIELGGKEGGAWIALRPEWYNAKIT